MADWAGNYHDTTCEWPQSSAVRIYDLAMPLEAGMSHHPYHPPYSFTLARAHGEWNYPGGVSAAMELITMGGHAGTHVDALGHIAHHGQVHGGESIAEHQSYTGGLDICSTEEIPPLIGRGHLVDAVQLFGRDLTPADGIGPAELEKWFGDHEPPGPGSIVLVRTGWIRLWPDVEAYIALNTGLPGVNRDGAGWLSERGILASGSDTMNYEHKVAGVVCLDVHVHYLVERGIYIMEQMNLERLAEDEVTDFTFFALPLRIKGGTGSPLRPVAIVGQ